MSKNSHNNSAVELLRFVFFLLIVSYHFSSHYLYYDESINLFCRGYLADEFFFLITGFYLAHTALKTDKNPIIFGFSSVFERIKKIAIPYYLSWFLCFIGKNYVNVQLGSEDNNIFDNFMNSFYELFFLKMFGFQKGFYSNVLSWFFSAVLIVSLIISPLIVKFKKTFLLYVAPVIAIAAYGILSLDYDYLHSPGKLIQNTFLMRGLVRAFAAMSLGCFIYGFVNSELFKKWLSASSKRRLFLLKTGDVILWGLIVIYCIYPHDTKFDEIITQYDFLCVFAMAIALIPVVAYVFVVENKALKGAIRVLGRFSFYGYFGQAVIYAVDQAVYQYPSRAEFKFLILFVCVIVFTMMLWAVDILVHKHKELKAYLQSAGREQS